MLHKFKLKKDMDFPIRQEFLEQYKFGYIGPQGLRIHAGYSWDGCSPKLRIFNKIIGIWDGPINEYGYPAAYRASLLYDFLCQYRPKGLTIQRIDNLFYRQLQADGFPFPRLYYFFVKLYHKIVRFL